MVDRGCVDRQGCAARGRRHLRLLLAAVPCVLVAAVLRTTDASFTASSASSASWTAGTVVVTDDAQGSALFSVTGMVPGERLERCLSVSYSGSLPAQLRLYGQTTGTGLESYLELDVTRGTFAGSPSSMCTGFSADAIAYLGPGHRPGDLYEGSLSGFPSSWTAASTDPGGAAPGVWRPSDAHAYRFSLTLGPTDAAQGLDATTSFVVTARSS